MGNAVLTTGTKNSFRLCGTSVNTDKRITCSIKCIGNTIRPKLCKMITAFSVLCFMVDHTRSYFHLTSGKVALEIGRVIHSIPKAELRIGEDIYPADLIVCIRDFDAAEKAVITSWNKHILFGRDPIFPALKHRIAEPVAAGICFQLCLYWLPGNIPNFSVGFQVHMEPILIQRAGIVTVTGQTPETGIFIKTVAACGVGNQRKKIFTSKVVNPGQRRARSINHIFPMLIIKMTVFHCFSILPFPFRQVLTAFPEHGGHLSPKLHGLEARRAGLRAYVPAYRDPS